MYSKRLASCRRISRRNISLSLNWTSLNNYVMLTFCKFFQNDAPSTAFEHRRRFKMTYLCDFRIVFDSGVMTYCIYSCFLPTVGPTGAIHFSCDDNLLYIL